MLLVVPPAHTNILLPMATQCCPFDVSFSHGSVCYTRRKGQACAIVQDEAQGWKGLLFHSS